MYFSNEYSYYCVIIIVIIMIILIIIIVNINVIISDTNIISITDLSFVDFTLSC